ncbi:hypothetical protein EKG37_21260 [Robertmurraya yapensis]|uniref:Uncharacterized protein n=1 Tax=Bacillus yapensis TaxID=2492960 RepID=A0A431VTQ5_9BACI|nr:hypothetical protein [Bacillus yapensis]RTR26600.1 hypothetical protein EKG37_21260 [Bacillus yapensis]TKS93775.1 hypothetical protein FAR12_21265 [Bacillus yapensis]
MNRFTLDARQLERKFLRFLQNQKSFLTVTGRENQFVSVNRDYLLIQSAKNQKPWSITRKKLRESIYYTFSKRTIVRKDVEQFSSFSSSLFAILFKCFEGMVHIKKLPSGLLRLSLKGCRVFFSGLERDPSIRQMVKEEGSSSLLLNYYYIRQNRYWTDILEDFTNVVIDSGGYSLFKKSLKKDDNEPTLFNLDDIPMITVEEYAAFIRRYQSHPSIIGFFNLDVVGDPVETKRNYQRLKELAPKATIYPVWQFSDSLEALEELVNEEHELISIGGLVPYLSTRQEVVRKKFKAIFSRFGEKTNFHFLGGGNELLLDFNLFSSDTTCYLNARKSIKQKKFYLENGERVDAPMEMSVMDVIRQNIRFLASLEKRYEPLQQRLV